MKRTCTVWRNAWGSPLNWVRWVGTLAALCMVPPAMAQGATDSGMLLLLRLRYPTLGITQVSASAVPGVFEVVAGKNVAYVDRSGRYFLTGHLVDMESKHDLTQARLTDINRIDASALPLDDAIKTVKGDGSRILYLFSDPECPFCQQLEKTLDDITDVTIYTFLYPIESIHPEAKTKAMGVWCANDRAAAWKAQMLERVVTVSPACDNPIERNLSLGATLGINSTPTLFSADGRRLLGAVPAARIAEFLNLRARE